MPSVFVKCLDESYGFYWCAFYFVKVNYISLYGSNLIPHKSTEGTESKVCTQTHTNAETI